MAKLMSKENLLSRKYEIIGERVKSLPFRAKGVFVKNQDDGLMTVSVTIERELTHEIMCQLSEAFGTKDINVGQIHPGCETCGDGRGITLFVLNVDAHPTSDITANMKNLTKEEMDFLRAGNREQTLEMVSGRLGVSKAFAQKLLPNLRK